MDGASWGQFFGLERGHTALALRIAVGIALGLLVAEQVRILTLPAHVVLPCQMLVGSACAAWALGARAPVAQPPP